MWNRLLLHKRKQREGHFRMCQSEKRGEKKDVDLIGSCNNHVILYSQSPLSLTWSIVLFICLFFLGYLVPPLSP